MYEEGLGVPRDCVQAYMWFDAAASRFSAEAEREPAVNNRANVATSMTPAQIVEAQRRARRWT